MVQRANEMLATGHTVVQLGGQLTKMISCPSRTFLHTAVAMSSEARLNIQTLSRSLTPLPIGKYNNRCSVSMQKYPQRSHHCTPRHHQSLKQEISTNNRHTLLVNTSLTFLMPSLDFLMPTW